MTASIGPAYTYFGAPAGGLVRWADNAGVLVWADGSSILFREELAEILRHFEPQGLPPFHALLFLLSACRGKVPELPSFRWKPNFGRLQAAVEGLERLRWLPRELISTTRAKCILAELVLEAVSGAVALNQGLLDFLPSLEQSVLNASSELVSFKDIEHALLQLHDGLQRVTVEALASRSKTNLDALPAPAEVPLSSARGVHDLLKQLDFEIEHAGLARVAREIMAALYLPRPLSDPEELPIGGVSDIANRGTLDRLLLSELAHDDLTLSARIALNDALYLRREPPAQTRATRPAVLLDVGLRMWGVPRLFATAVGLAVLAKRGENGMAWRARSSLRIEPIDLSTKEGLTEHLGTLDSYADPGGSLAQFTKVVADDDSVDPFLVTHREVADDPDFKRALAEMLICRPLYLATVDREGRFELVFCSSHGQKPICRATICLENLFPKPIKSGVPLLDPVKDPNLPLILSIRPLPLLLPVWGKIDFFAPRGKDGGLAVMKDRRVLCWESRLQGARTVAESAPGRGKTIWGYYDEAGEVVHVARYVQGRKVLLSSVACLSGESMMHELRVAEAPLRVHHADGALFLISTRKVEVFSIYSGEPIGTIQVPAPHYISSGKYFFNPETGWCFLSFDGLKASLEQVTMKPECPEEHILVLVDRAGFEGPWIVTKNLDVISPENRVALHTGVPAQLVQKITVGEDGGRLLVSRGDRLSSLVLNLQTGLSTEVDAKRARDFGQVGIFPPSRNLRHRFDAIYAAPGEPLLLLTGKGLWMELKLTLQNMITLQTCPHPPERQFQDRPFTRVCQPGNHSYTLTSASWPNGSRAWLDSRGLLHLQSHDRELPELCIGLAEGAVPIWSSDGELCGPVFFTGDKAVTEPRVQFEKVRAFVERCA